MIATLRRLMRIGDPPWGRLAAAVGLGLLGGLATLGLLAGSGYVVDRAALRPGLGAIAGVLAGVEVLAFLRGPLRYGERLQGHDAAFRALSRWRLWLFDRLEPLSPAGLAAWRSGDLLARATDDVDTSPDLYLRLLLPVVVTTSVAVVAVVVIGIILPLAALVLGLALAVALGAIVFVARASGPGRARQQALMGQLSAEIVELLQAAPDLTAYGRDEAARERIEELDGTLTRLAGRRAWTAGATSALVTFCLGAAVIGVLAAGVAALHDHRLSAVMVGVLP
jgi:ABC-type transport system involved in cytochrome bd biosynthesis fused ATPase/permease subunit